MKRVFFLISICITLSRYIAAQAVPQLGKDPVDVVIKAMTLNEKVSLLIGTGMAGMNGGNAAVGETKNMVPGAAGTTCPIPRLGIPAIVLADGPAGLRIQPTRQDDPNTYYCTAFPIGTLLASTWNVGVVEQVGKAMGNEVLEYGVDVLLAPALNIHRNPLCGRNFEYYSEDPLITGKIAAAYVKGIQSNGVGTSIKHFAGNNQESNRNNNDVRISQRAFREIYLKGFEIAVKEALPWTVMSSYNKVNGTYTSENRALLTDILRDEWGFQGTVMTDWFGGKNSTNQMHAGNDLLMPGTPAQATAIEEAVKNGSLTMADIDTNVARILRLIVNSPHFKKYRYSNKPDLKAHAAVARESAAEGMVLLKNAANTLPFGNKVKKVAAYGITSYDWIVGGTGSGDVNRAYTISLVQGLSNAGYSLDNSVKSTYEKYMAVENEKNKPDASNPFARFFPKKRIPEMVPVVTDLDAQVATNDIAIITLGRTAGEFFDRKLEEGDFLLSDTEHKLIESVCSAYHKAGKKVVVVLNIGGVIETASWKERPDAILLAWQTGQEGGNSVTDILSSKVTPSGKLAVTFPVNYMDAASSSNFPYNYTPDMRELMNNMMGNSTKHDSVRNIDYTNYEEDIYVGYRYFDTFGKQVSFPFGHGLSYTNFAFCKASVKENKGKFTIAVAIKNTGKTAGKEVAQLYVSAPRAGYPAKPGKELKAFAKTRLLHPGEEQTLLMDLSLQDLASFNDKVSAWVADAGNYDIQIGSSSQDIRLNLTLKVSSKTVTNKAHDVLNPKENIRALTKQ